jgi:lysozyme
MEPLNKRAVAAGLTGITLAAALFIAPFEGEKTKANIDPVGVKEICYGHTPGVVMNTEVSDKQCIIWLGQDTHFAASIVEKSAVGALPPKTEIAFISFVYNVGVGKKSVKDGFIWLKNGQHSRMYKYFHSGNLVEACGQLTNWTKNLKGLRRRRAAEQKLCLEGLQK